MEATLHLVLGAESHVIAKIVEAELVVRTISNIRLIGSPLLFRGLTGRYNTYLQTQEAIQFSHPLGIAAGQVVVHGNQMHALASQRIQVYGQRRYQRFTFTGFHLGNTAFVKRDTADHLHVVMAHPHDSTTRLTSGGKRFRKQCVKALAFVIAATKFRSLTLQLGVGQIAILLFKLINTRYGFAHPLDFSGVLTAEHLGCKLCEHRPLLL